MFVYQVSKTIILFFSCLFSSTAVLVLSPVYKLAGINIWNLIFEIFSYRYLQEVGYTDTILDVRSQRVRSLLGLSSSEPNGSVETKNLEQILNGGESPKQKGQEIKRYDLYL